MTKRAAVVNDLSSFGRCSLTAYIAVLSAMGVRPCPLPTAVLSAQSEFERHFCRDLTGDMPRFIRAWEENGERFDCICAGYFASAEQIGFTLDLINKFCANGIVLTDPVMGDDGELYPGYDAKAIAAMKKLVSRADVITPNLTELCLLTGADYSELAKATDEDSSLRDIAALAKQIMPRLGMIVTGIRSGGDVCSLALCGDDARTIRRKMAGGRFSGTGDLFSAAVCGCLMNGRSLFDAAETAADFVSASIADTVAVRHDPLYGVEFEKNLIKLVK